MTRPAVLNMLQDQTSAGPLPASRPRTAATASVVFILSTNYSGSHYASLMMGSHSKAVHVGEVCHLRKPRTKRNVCDRCGGHKNCPLFKSVTPETIGTVFEQIFSALPEEKSVIVDNSKKVQWASRFLDHPGFTKKVIHLIRDPRALVRRWDVSYTTPAEVWKQRWRWMLRDPRAFFRLLAAPPRAVYLRKWLGQNEKITRMIRARGLDHLVVTYCDLANDPEGELRRIMSWVGLEYEKSQVNYWTVDHHGSQKPAYEWVKTRKRRFVDERWKQYLPVDEQASIAADPAVKSYLAGIGVRITPDGLTRRTVS